MSDGLDNTYRAVFDHSSTPLLVISESGIISDLNSAAAKLFRVSVKELTGTTSSKVLKPLDGSMQGKSNQEPFKATGTTGDGEKISLSCLCSVLLEKENGNVLLLEVEKKDTNLSMFESVVVNGRDAVLVTKAEPVTAPDGPEIVYVNRAFTTMTGYSFDEVLGKTPRILQGRNSESPELEKLRHAIAENIPTDVELINYKKSGEEFWVQISLTPLLDERGICTHYIAIERDITDRKNREMLKKLQGEVRELFNEKNSLKNIFEAILHKIISYGDFPIAELWLVNNESSSIDLTSYVSRDQDRSAARFYEDSNPIMSFPKGEGLPGMVWKTAETRFWNALSYLGQYHRKEQALSAGIEAAISIPVLYNKVVVGALLVGLDEGKEHEPCNLPFLKEFVRDLGTEIKRKQSEEELSRIFSFSPDIICVASLDGYFKKVNPAMSRLLGYTQDELLAHPVSSFTHPDDRRKTELEMDAINLDKGTQIFKNRLLAKDGSVIWLSWTTRTFYEEGKVYSIARNITEQKELESLLKQANRLAKIGGWEVDIINDEHNWSDVTREIHEVEPGYEPGMDLAIQFYKEGDSRIRIEKAVEKAIEQGIPFDLEVQIVTAKGNEKWVRTIGDPEIVDGICVRLYGSFQDIDLRKQYELKLHEKSHHIDAIARLNSALLNYSEWKTALKSNLAVIGEAVRADRVYFFENRFDTETGKGFTSQVFEWCRNGIKSELGNPDLKDIPFEELPELINPMLEKRASSARISDIDAGGTIRRVMESQNIKTFLVIPVYVQDKFHGFVGFDNCTTEEKWNDEEVRTLTTITSNLAVAIERYEADKNMQDILEERNRILKSITDAFYAVDGSWAISYFNSEAENLLHVESDEVMEKNIWDVFPAAKNTELFDNYREVMNDGFPKSFEYYYPPLSSWYDISAYPAGNGISVYFKNINERKETQARILEKTRQLKAIAKFNGHLIKLDDWKEALQKSFKIIGKAVDADRVYFFQNSFNEETGQNTAHILSKWEDKRVNVQVDHPAHREIPFSKLEEFLKPLEANHPYSSVVDDISDPEFMQLLKEQGIKSILAIPVFVGSEFYGTIGFDDCTHKREWRDEEISFLQTISINLTSAIENENAEEALKKAYNEKNEILESIGDAFFAVDKNWVITYWNKVAEEELQMLRENMMGKKLWDINGDAVDLDFYSGYHKAMHEHRMVTFEEYYPTIEKWFDVSAYPSAEGLAVFFKDVTDRKHRMEELKELNRTLELQANELAASNAELEQFAFVASHDLQEPLRMVTSFLSQLEKKYGDELDEKAKQYIWYATDGAKRMRQIILDLLDYSRTGQTDMKKENVDLNLLMESVVRDYGKPIREKKAMVAWNSLPVIVAAGQSINRLLSNLLSNALKYQAEDRYPKIEVRADDLGNKWKISVSDNGIGIEEEYSEKIFNIFQRLHSKEEYTGTGIGLAICRKIVDAHGGKIWVESEFNTGSTFHFTIKKPD